jgi:chemotaxis protein histidine kinase CheA
MQDHDGAIEVKSKVNEGTAFILKLPLNNSNRSSNSMDTRKE